MCGAITINAMLRPAIASNLTGWYMAHTGIARDSCRGSTKLKKQQLPYGYCLRELLFCTLLPSAKLLLYYWNNLQWIQSVLWPSPRGGHYYTHCTDTFTLCLNLDSAEREWWGSRRVVVDSHAERRVESIQKSCSGQPC